MIRYTISYRQPHHQFVTITLEIAAIETPEIALQLPAWRPGRYELANYAQNIRQLRAESADGVPLNIRKTTKDRWVVSLDGHTGLRIHYTYYAGRMDAGGCWLDEGQLYLNFVNCLLYAEDRLHHPCEVQLELPDNYRVACALGTEKVLRAATYHELADSPLIASASLKHHAFEVAGKTMHWWLMGAHTLDLTRMEADFSAFAATQLEMMGEAPFDDYHFLFQLVPYRLYHGVEHQRCTVIALGPGDQLNGDLYQELLGVSSHELFHSWNVCSIRPAELYPYDFSREQYFETGYVAEGVTTYYGDLLLARSGVFSKEAYFAELNKVVKRHFDNYGRFHRSVAESSFDLWLDGYVPGIPHRKTSIYIKGAVIALILDLEIRRLTDDRKSLDDVMRLLWRDFAQQQRGYTKKDYQQAAETVAGSSLEDYFTACVDGTEPLEERLDTALRWIGCRLEKSASPEAQEALFGFRVAFRENTCLVTDVAPGSPADNVLAHNDQLLTINGAAVQDPVAACMRGAAETTLTLLRHGRKKTVTLQPETQTYYPRLEIVQEKDRSSQAANAFNNWLGCH